MKKLLSLAFMVLAFAACRKKELPAPVTPGPNNPIDSVSAGTLKLNFHNMVGSEELVLNRTAPYTAPNGEQYAIRSFNYYISNIVFVDASGNRFSENESYHLIRAEQPSSLNFSVAQIPSGNYVAVEFLIGVDSARNVSGAQTGDLSPDYGMFWTWKTGYIMAKMEGTLQSDGSPLIYHIAGFSKPYSGIRKVTLPLSTNAIISANKQTDIYINADLNKWFTTPGFPGFSVIGIITSTSLASSAIADNYTQMFSVMSVQNP